ncbi:hypothetical protein [[Mycoplasma] gypis]|uniref:hypothetical protein n=1 Tax=[Mycoplasma] gypis TaxID=92404 RepID=UPI0019681505|nr:hypothetical protein [[Mycoplasma] gypis]MBN0919438.1 hypothetical protein [[Mycoplasma] gypis]
MKKPWFSTYEEFIAQKLPTKPQVRAFFNYIINPSAETFDNKTKKTALEIDKNNKIFEVYQARDIEKLKNFNNKQIFKEEFTKWAKLYIKKTILKPENDASYLLAQKFLTDSEEILQQIEQQKNNIVFKQYFNNSLVLVTNFKISSSYQLPQTNINVPFKQEFSEITIIKNPVGNKEIQIFKFFNLSSSPELFKTVLKAKTNELGYLWMFTSEGILLKINKLFEEQPVAELLSYFDIYEATKNNDKSEDTVPPASFIKMVDFSETTTEKNKIDLIIYTKANDFYYMKFVMNLNPEASAVIYKSAVRLGEQTPTHYSYGFEMSNVNNIAVNNFIKNINKKSREFCNLFITNSGRSKTQQTQKNKFEQSWINKKYNSTDWVSLSTKKSEWTQYTVLNDSRIKSKDVKTFKFNLLEDPNFKIIYDTYKKNNLKERWEFSKDLKLDLYLYTLTNKRKTPTFDKEEMGTKPYWKQVTEQHPNSYTINYWNQQKYKNKTFTFTIDKTKIKSLLEQSEPVLYFDAEILEKPSQKSQSDELRRQNDELLSHMFSTSGITESEKYKRLQLILKTEQGNTELARSEQNMFFTDDDYKYNQQRTQWGWVFRFSEAKILFDGISFEEDTQNRELDNSALKIVIREDENNKNGLRFDVENKKENTYDSRAGFFVNSDYVVPLKVRERTESAPTWRLYSFNSSFNALYNEDGTIKQIIQNKQPFEIFSQDDEFYLYKIDNENNSASILLAITPEWNLVNLITQNLDTTEYDYISFSQYLPAEITGEIDCKNNPYPIQWMEQNHARLLIKTKQNKYYYLTTKNDARPFSTNNYPYLYKKLANSDTLSETFTPATMDAYEMQTIDGIDTSYEEYKQMLETLGNRATEEQKRLLSTSFKPRNVASANISNVAQNGSEVTFTSIIDANTLKTYKQDTIPQDWKIYDNNKNELFSFQKEFFKTNHETILLNYKINFNFWDGRENDWTRNEQKSQQFAGIYSNLANANNFIIEYLVFTTTDNATHTTKKRKYKIEPDDCEINGNALWLTVSFAHDFGNETSGSITYSDFYFTNEEETTRWNLTDWEPFTITNAEQTVIKDFALCLDF